MREFKFRAWSPTQKKYYYFGLNPGYDSIPSSDIHYQTWQGRIIEQYTGLKDKNGKEIYEGDIVKVWHIDNSGPCQIQSWKNLIVSWCVSGWCLVTIPDGSYLGGERIEFNECQCMSIICNINESSEGVKK